MQLEEYKTLKAFCRAGKLFEIQQWIAEGKPITLALFPHAEHGMTEYEVASNGERVSTRYAPGYFTMMRDYARNGHLSGSYGSSELVKPTR